MTIPRPEHPRPQIYRPDWQCLNGKWDFQRDYGDSGEDQGFLERDFDESISVPFCIESELSGHGHVDFINAVWYRRAVTIPQDWAGKRALLHFQAVDYDATVWINKQQAALHRGGFCGFTVDLSHYAQAGETVEVCVRARDDHRQSKPMGKQASSYENRGCHYTRTTGIWQTVWLEAVGQSFLDRPRITPRLSDKALSIEQSVKHAAPGMQIKAVCNSNGTAVSEAKASLGIDFTTELRLTIAEADLALWSTSHPHLYDIEISLFDSDGTLIDSISTYAGMRSISIDGKRILINGQSVFQRLVLDQGYYKDGIMTAPSDEALIEDIQLSIDAGFNGARLHQKVFEERFLYHADRMGYLVWGEFGDWAGNTIGRQNSDWSAGFITQWLEIVERDYSHPSLIGWCPLNETHSNTHDELDKLHDLTLGMYDATKAADKTRPVLDSSGYCHRIFGADVYDSHDYDQNPETFAKRHQGLMHDLPFINQSQTIGNVPYAGQPYMVSEFGGTWWNAAKAETAGKDREKSWGYGDRIKNLDEFYERFDGLCSTLLQNPDMFGYCYTQLTDVFQEENGIYYFDRSVKFDMQRIKQIQQQVAAIEKTEPVET